MQDYSGLLSRIPRMEDSLLNGLLRYAYTVQEAVQAEITARRLAGGMAALEAERQREHEDAVLAEADQIRTRRAA